jgi:hypothetical protein
MRKIHVVALDLEDRHDDGHRSAALLLLLMEQLLPLLLPSLNAELPVR